MELHISPKSMQRAKPALWAFFGVDASSITGGTLSVSPSDEVIPSSQADEQELSINSPPTMGKWPPPSPIAAPVTPTTRSRIRYVLTHGS